MEAVRHFCELLHFGTRFIAVSIALIYILEIAILDSTLTSRFTFCPRMIIERCQVWRLITATYMHASLFHVTLNLITFTFLGLTLESSIGTFSFFYHIILLGILSNLMHVLVAYGMLASGEGSEVVAHGRGFSGVLFGLIVIDLKLSGGDHRSVFGLFLVPAWSYPWVMLLLLSLLMPNVSFFGHISGLITGYLYKYRILSFIAPGQQFFGRIERLMCPCCINRFSYLAAEGIRDANYQPFALFRRFFREHLSDDSPPPGAALQNEDDDEVGDAPPDELPLDLSDEDRFAIGL